MESGTLPSNITKFHVLVGLGVRLTELGFSGHNSVVESRTFPTCITEFYILVGVRLIDGGGILRAEFCGGISPQPGAILSSFPPI